jgi:CRISPR/Cas system-associated exonuclease Cas4 (RecB family)
MALPANFQFSQGSLQDYVDCPKRFQLKYIENLAWPALETEPALESENHMVQGAIFHRLVQQFLLGVSVEKLSLLAETDTNLVRWWGNFLSSFQMLEGLKNESGSGYIRHPEIDLSLTIGDYRLTGKFDLLLLTGDEFIIYDWKTARTQPKREWVQASMQTRVYPYLLRKAGGYLNNGIPISPSQIKMIYWYANYPTSPLEINFNKNQLKEDQRHICKLIEEIIQLTKQSFPMTENKKRCNFCSYRSFCNRGEKAGSFEDIEVFENQELDDFRLDFEQIAEIEY